MKFVPEVECFGCGRRAACLRMKDGTVYKPFAWKYPDVTEPLGGICGDCQCRVEAAVLIDRVKKCKTVEEYEDLKQSMGLESAQVSSKGESK